MGSPGRIVREVDERDLAMITRAATIYRERARQYRHELLRDEHVEATGPGR
jgi:carbonic anhydrase/acetyltransferase-like protein (isoleucine patch superfamily)